ncbi:hypothetical protein MKW94_020115 [Papaver nudicaule]|uniref:Uncharacterized protein n=1 Tax=Papaver nudicaule TaxID=74823 RepID=A0AA41VI10_PAPNU|nr:hypothetical protein [Papaver nudicaule]
MIKILSDIQSSKVKDLIPEKKMKNKGVEMGESSERLAPVIMIDGLDLEKKDFYKELEEPLQIFIIPTYIKRRNPTAYMPKMVSIGPYHYGNPDLEPMQFHKERALIHFLRRSPTKATKEQYIDALICHAPQLRKSYENVKAMERGSQTINDYAPIDPIFGDRGHNLNYNYVMEDLLLLENQVPYQVLFILLTVSEGCVEEAATNILSSLMLAPPESKGNHLLDMYIKGMLGERNRQQPNTKIPASKLIVFGIKFKAVGTYRGIVFDQSTKTLSLPSIFINQHTVPRFYNSKVYELRVGTNTELNSYIHLLDVLIQSVDDVSSLRSQGIIVSALDTDDAVIKVMNELTKDTVPGDVDSLSIEIINELAKYYHDKDGKVTTFWIWLTQNWVKFLVAGFLLYVLTGIQAVYSMLSFHLRH